MGKAGRGEASMGVPECGVKGECPRVLCGGRVRSKHASVRSLRASVCAVRGRLLGRYARPRCGKPRRIARQGRLFRVCPQIGG